MVKGFFGQYRWLSNFYYSPIIILDKEFQTVEHFYQARKADDPEEAEQIRLANGPQEAKRLGKLVKNFNHNYPKLKKMFMKVGVRAKFEQHPDLERKLLDTGDMLLEETNSWGDIYWGVCNGVGQNVLGMILMDIREEIRFEKNIYGY